MKKVFVVMIALLTMVAFASSVMAQAPAKPAEPAKAAEPAKSAVPAEKAKADKPKAEKKAAPSKFMGAVAGYEAGKMIKVKGKDKEMSFDVTGDTKVTGEVKDGAKVTVTYKKDGDKMVATAIAVPAAKKAAEKKATEKKAAEKKPAAEPAKPAAPAAPEKK